MRSKSLIPPKVPSYPLVGSSPALLRGKFGFLRETREKYGDVFELDLGFAVFTVVCHPRHAQHLLVDNTRNYVKSGPLWDGIRTLLGDGLPFVEGDVWKRNRLLMQPAFHRQRLIGLVDGMVDAIDEVFDDWAGWAQAGEPFDIGAACNRLTMHVLVRALFGTGMQPGEPERIGEAFDYAIRYMMIGSLSTRWPQWLPMPGRARYHRAIRKIDEIVRHIVDRGRQGLDQDGAHLLALLLNTVDADTGERMTDRQLRDETVTLFAAGYETTAVTLSFAFHLMAQYPEAAQRMRDEVDTVLGRRRPGFGDLAALPYTRNVLLEAVRLYSPAYYLTRTAVGEDEIDGFRIPAGRQVLIATYLIHHHPEVWPDPLRFDPDRFTPQRSEGRHKQALMAFGAGQRQCIGKEFALTEAHLVLARAVQRYILAPVPGRENQVGMAASARAKDGVWVRMRHR
ncbi:cytochrome P450 [Streptosporangium becharense]|uniref:Cytochrome P450 n=1 Tax=Streptosporangium becharense TaxID=1816182 RepID=A0A7W9MK28_9ACTN|nr:cytochrome P450 [Streptosporangium becharense]MBB2910321.1 cytochrome P450 [Streptosporangium becharense]MBB5823064.1 cytochrome P450 [Streptosporangium becharense]